MSKSRVGMAVGAMGVALASMCLSGCSQPSWKDWAQYSSPVLTPEYETATVISAGSSGEAQTGPEQLAGPQNH